MLRAAALAAAVVTCSSFAPTPSFSPFAGGVSRAVLSRTTVPSLAARYTDSSGAEIKGALSAYMQFCGERRASLTAELKAQHGEAYKNTMPMKQLGAEWKTLPDGDVARFKQLEADDRMRFAAAVASNPANADVKRSRKKTTTPRAPRAPTAYMTFCNQRRPSLTAELKASLGERFKNQAVMVALGAEWKAMSDDAKAQFKSA